jgi:hypothetical protein
MKKIKIWYWILTGLLAAFILFSAIPDIMVTPEAVAIVTTHLGYPKYLIAFLGIAKLLAAIAIIVPGFPRLKEWAYAGWVFDLTGAMYSSLAVGDPASGIIFFVIFFALTAASYILLHKKQQAVSVNYARGIS